MRSVLYQNRGKQCTLLAANSLHDITWGNTELQDKTVLGKVFPSSRNRSKECDILLYNRVPKCGSSTIVQIMKNLGVFLMQQDLTKTILNAYYFFQEKTKSF